MEQYKGDRFGLVVAFWGLALLLGTPQVSQTDYNEKLETFGKLRTRNPFTLAGKVPNESIPLPTLHHRHLLRWLLLLLRAYAHRCSKGAVYCSSNTSCL